MGILLGLEGRDLRRRRPAAFHNAFPRPAAMRGILYSAGCGAAAGGSSSRRRSSAARAPGALVKRASSA